MPGDGAMGTRLMERGMALESCFEERCVSEADVVRQVHDEYLAAGARVIRTNSFGANAVRLARHGLEHRVSEINWSAAQIACDAARGKGVFVAGSVGPLGISGEQARERGIDRAEVFNEQIGALLDGGARVILLETFLDVEEQLIALEVKHSLHHCPVICSLTCDAAGRLADGTELAPAFAKLREAGADVVGINCVNGPDAAVRHFARLPVEGLCSAYPNGGVPDSRDGRLVHPTTPEAFARAAVQLAKQGVRLIGGCCGLGPSHISAMVEALREGGFLQASDAR